MLRSISLIALVFLISQPAWSEEAPDESRTLYEVYQVQLHQAFRIAARDGRLKNMEELRELGADVNSGSPEGLTALMYASRNCSTEVVRYLLGHGADPNRVDQSGRTALIHAVKGGCLPVVRALASTPGLEFNIQDHEGRDAFHHARGSYELEQALRAVEKRKVRREGKIQDGRLRTPQGTPQAEIQYQSRLHLQIPAVRPGAAPRK